MAPHKQAPQDHTPQIRNPRDKAPQNQVPPSQAPESISAHDQPPKLTPPVRNIMPTVSGAEYYRTDGRVKLSQHEKVTLIRLCIRHQDDYRQGNKKGFWIKIRRLLHDEIGKEIRVPQKQMQKLVTDFESQMTGMWLTLKPLVK